MRCRWISCALPTPLAWQFMLNRTRRASFLLHPIPVTLRGSRFVRFESHAECPSDVDIPESAVFVHPRHACFFSRFPQQVERPDRFVVRSGKGRKVDRERVPCCVRSIYSQGAQASAPLMSWCSAMASFGVQCDACVVTSGVSCMLCRSRPFAKSKRTRRPTQLKKERLPPRQMGTSPRSKGPSTSPISARSFT